MKIVCPHCGEVCETACEIRIGQHVICPFCKVKFSYGADSVSPVATSARKSIKFDFERCERELSDKWNGRGRRRKKKLNKWWIVVLGVGVLANLVFLVFGLPICLEEWRKPPETYRTPKTEKELRASYEKLLFDCGLKEAPGTGSNGRGFCLQLFVPGRVGVTIITLDVATKEVSISSPIKLSHQLARRLVELRYALDKFEVPIEFVNSILDSECR